MRPVCVLLVGLLGAAAALTPLAGTPGQVRGGIIVIDNFATPGDGTAFFAPGDPALGAGYPNNGYTRQDTGAGIVDGNGTRELRMELVGAGPFPFDAAAGWMPPGELYFATFGGEGSRLHLEYSPGPGTIDLTAGGANSFFLIQFSSIDPGFSDFLRLVTTVTDLFGDEVTHSIDLPGAVAPVVHELHFSDFGFANPPGNPSADLMQVFSNAERIHFVFNAHEVPIPNVDFGILNIVIIPEPSTALLGALGILVLVGLGGRNRRTLGC